MKRPAGFDEPLPKNEKKPQGNRSPVSIFSKKSDRGLVNSDLADGTDSAVPDEGSKKMVSPKLLQKRLDRRQRLIERAEMKRFTRHQRKRRVLWLTSLSIVVVFAIALMVAVFSPLFAIRQVAVEGTNRLSVTEIEAALSGQFGTPLPLLNRAEVGDVLSQFSLIESYTVESMLPDTLQIRLVERSPVVAQKVGDGYAIFDAAGVKIESSTEIFQDYPLLVLNDGNTGARPGDAGFEPAVNVLRALPHDVYAQVKEISATTTDDVTFVLRDKNKTVLWGDSSQPELKAKLLAELLESVPQGKNFDVSSTTMPSVK